VVGLRRLSGEDSSSVSLAVDERVGDGGLSLTGLGVEMPSKRTDGRFFGIRVLSDDDLSIDIDFAFFRAFGG